MMNEAEGSGTERSDDAFPAPAAGPGPSTPGYRAPVDRGVPKLARGIVWSDLVREMEAEHVVRLRARADDTVARLRTGRYDHGLDEAA